ncbi:MAG: hypothetical protein ABI995_06440 [Acidobacteriota bacterium]
MGRFWIKGGLFEYGTEVCGLSDVQRVSSSRGGLVSFEHTTYYTVFMPREIVTVRMEPETRQTLDEIAALQKRDRSHVINEALSTYIDLHRWQVDHIQQGLRESDAGAFASDEEVDRTLRKLRRK